MLYTLYQIRLYVYVVSQRIVSTGGGKKGLF